MGTDLTQQLSETEITNYQVAWSGGSPLIEYVSTKPPYRVYRWDGTRLVTSGGVSYTSAEFAALPLATRQSMAGITVYSSSSPYAVLGVVDGGGNLSSTGGSVGVVVNNTSAATENVTAIQAALNSAGDVNLSGSGTVWLNGTLIIKSNTRLKISKSLTLKQMPGTNLAMLIPEAFQQYLTGATVTIAWTFGAYATVTWAAHGLTNTDYVWLRGANESVYNNVFRVAQVVDANTFNIVPRRAPTGAATGTVKAVKCTSNFEIDGGTWDYDILNNGGGADWNRDNFVLIGAANFTVSNVTHLNFHRGVTSGALADYLFQNCTYGAPQTIASEGHKTFGPINRGKLFGLNIKSTDDGASTQTKEAPAFSWAGIPFGDIYDVSFEKCSAHSIGSAAAGALVVYASDTEIMDSVSYKDCMAYSEQGTGFVVKYGTTFSTGVVGTIDADGLQAGTGTATAQYPLSIAAPVRVLRIKKFRPIVSDLANSVIRLQATATIGTMVIDGMHIDNSAYPSAAANVISMNGTIDSIKVTNSYVSLNAANATLFGVGGTNKAFDIDNCAFKNCLKVVNITGTLQSVRINASTISNTPIGIEPRSTATPCSINLTSNTFDTLSTGVIRPSTGAGVTCRIYGGGNTFVSAATVAATGSATFEMHSFDMPINIGQTGAIKTVAGQYAYNTTLQGTLLANRLATCNGTNWVQVDVPANVF